MQDFDKVHYQEARQFVSAGELVKPKKTIDDLTKDDLIVVIATMNDIIQDWRTWTDPEEAQIISKVGVLCINHCIENNNNWTLPELIFKK